MTLQQTACSGSAHQTYDECKGTPQAGQAHGNRDAMGEEVEGIPSIGPHCRQGSVAPILCFWADHHTQDKYSLLAL